MKGANPARFPWKPFADWVMQAHADFFLQFFGNRMQLLRKLLAKIEAGFMADKAWPLVSLNVSASSEIRKICFTLYRICDGSRQEHIRLCSAEPFATRFGGWFGTTSCPP